MRRTLFAVAAAMAVATVAYAGNQNDAGCGAGSLLFKDDSAPTQILAATTNGILLNQSFGITSGTLGCSSGGILKAEKERDVFIAVNYRNLSRDLAAGSGEYATSFAKLLGCDREAVPSFLSFAKEKYTALIPSEQTTGAEFLRNVAGQIAQDPVLSKACTL